jgi:two-component system, NarL family, nitrate/nitrite response regulator NarL
MGERNRTVSPKERRPRLLFLDQQNITRAAISSWLQRVQRRFDVESADYDIANLETRNDHRHVELLLLNVGGESAVLFDSLPVLAERFPQIPIVLVTDADNPDLIVQAWKYGVRGVINPEMDQHQVVQALHLVHDGGASFPAEILSRCFERGPELVAFAVREQDNTPHDPNGSARLSASSAIPASEPRRLSSRETEVRDHLQQGHSNKQIARALCISENTVKVYVQRVKLKLGVGTRIVAAQAAR